MNAYNYIDINCDVGEGVGNEAALFPYISSCNIACGGHAGDEDSMLSIVGLAKKHQIQIGAHPSYPDRNHFGRISMKMNSKELSQSVQSQIEALLSISRKEQSTVHHIKPHGALYNDVVKDKNLASVFLEAITEYKSKLFLCVPCASEIEKLAVKNGFKIKREAFVDRNYNQDLSLVSRKNKNALLTQPEAVLEHLVTMVKKNLVKTVSGNFIKIAADSYCIHGDTPNALQILTYITEQFPNLNIRLKK